MVAMLATMGACELALPVYEVADGAADATVDQGVPDVSLDTTSDGPLDAETDASVTGCDAVGLLAYFPIDEDSGNSFHDCVANKTAIVTGPYTWQMRAPSHPSITFLGADDAGDAGSYAIVDQSSYNFPMGGTLALWLRVDRYLSTEQIVLTTRATNNFAVGWQLIVNGNQQSLSFLTGYGGAGGTAVGPTAGTWTHVAVVLRPGSDITFYINGASQGAQPFDAGEGSVNNDLVFGQGEQYVNGPQGKYFFYGSIDEVRIFGRPLSDAEVAELAQQ